MLTNMAASQSIEADMEYSWRLRGFNLFQPPCMWYHISNCNRCDVRMQGINLLFHPLRVKVPPTYLHMRTWPPHMFELPNNSGVSCPTTWASGSTNNDFISVWNIGSVREKGSWYQIKPLAYTLHKSPYLDWLMCAVRLVVKVSD